MAEADRASIRNSRKRSNARAYLQRAYPRIEPSLEAAIVDYAMNATGFFPFKK